MGREGVTSRARISFLATGVVVELYPVTRRKTVKKSHRFNGLRVTGWGVTGPSGDVTGNMSTHFQPVTDLGVIR